MDVLKEKQLRTYDYVSRYATFPFYYNDKDKKYIYGITSQINTKNQFIVHELTKNDTLEYLAFIYYGRPDLYWVIADFNRINDPFKNLKQSLDSIKIPVLSNISFSK